MTAWGARSATHKPGLARGERKAQRGQHRFLFVVACCRRSSCSFELAICSVCRSCACLACLLTGLLTGLLSLLDGFLASFLATLPQGYRSLLLLVFLTAVGCLSLRFAAKIGPRTPEDYPKSTQDFPRSTRRRPKSPPTSPQIYPRTPQEPKSGTNTAKSAPSAANIGPDTPEGAQ